MTTLSSILTISEDLDYGESIRQNYQDRLIETYYLPGFIETDCIVQTILPDAIILDLQPENLEEGTSFLEQLLEFQQATPEYTPHILISQATSNIIHQALVTTLTELAPYQGSLKKEGFITLEEFQPEVLLILLSLIIVESESQNLARRTISQNSFSLRSNSYRFSPQLIAC